MPTIEQTETKTLCWINTEEKPIKVERHGVFTCNHTRTDNEDFRVFELCTFSFSREGVVTDKLLEWEEVAFTPHTEELFKNHFKTGQSLKAISCLPDWLINDESIKCV